MRGAGGTPGGILHFIFGLAMMLGGLFTLGSNIHVSSGFGFGFGYRLFAFGGYGVNAGSLLLSFLVGIGFLFYNGRSILGWVLTLASLGAIIVGVIMSLNVAIRPMSLIDISFILILIGGGFGLFLRSLRSA